MKKSNSESVIQKNVIKYFCLKRCFVMRINSGSMISEKRYFRAYFIESLNGISKGCSDLLISKNGIFVFVEMKTDKGKQSESQKIFEAHCKSRNVNYEICRSIDDAEKINLKYFENS